MKFSCIILVVILQFASAKISGGPRGRFDKNVTRKVTNYHVSAHHTHFSYHPPSKIYFMCHHCSNFAAYPVYNGPLPTYVYKYRESSGRFSSLLAGLALYNLGKASTDHWQYTHFYSLRPKEKCSMQIIDHHKHFEKIAFPCFIMSSFIARSAESFMPDPYALDITSPQIDIRPYLNHNGSTLKVTRDQECVLWHNTTDAQEKKTVPCALLKEYAETMKPTGVPVYMWLPITVAVVIAISVCCQCYNKKTVKHEETPFNNAFPTYCSNVF